MAEKDQNKDISFSALFNIDDIQKLQNQFSNAVGVASIITEPDGTPITTPSNFCRLCKDIIRKTEIGRKNCQYSDSNIGKDKIGGPTVKRCMSGGLWDAGAAIIVNGIHIASWLIGQVRDSTQDESTILEYAKIIGADPDEALKAFNEVKILDPTSFKAIANALFILANQLSKIAYQNLQKSSLIKNLKNTKKELEGSIKKLKDAEQEREKYHHLETLGTLAAGIAHDFNNLFLGIFGNIEIAKTYINSEHIAFNHLNKALDVMEQAQLLTKQFLTFSKGEVPDFKTLNIEKLLKDTTLFNLSGKAIKADFKIDKDLWDIYGDKSQIVQVISNLVVNGAQAMNNRGSFYISAENFIDNNGDKFIKLIFKDQGSGINKKNIDKIFNPYFTTKKTGNGLGLSIVYSVIKKHKGSIKIDSKIGEGTKFTIKLPAIIDRKDYSIVQDKNRENYIKKDCKVLLMDDDQDIAKVVKLMLNKIGCDVDTVKDGSEALDRYLEMKNSENKYDIVILDLTIIGGMGGKETGQKLLEIDPNAKIVISSGYLSKDIILNYKKYGFQAKLSKPYYIKDLKNVITRIME